MRRSTLLIASITPYLIAGIGSASAATIDFDSARGRNGRTGYVYGAFTEEGYQVSADRCSSPAGTCFVTTGTTLTSLDRTGAALTNFLGSAVTTFSAVDGGAFLLSSMDMAGNYGNFSGFSPTTLGAQFTFNLADGTSMIEDYVLQNTPGNRLTVNNLTFDKGPLLSFSWKPTAGTSGFLQFDNIQVSAVPEPATWAMMMLGFGAIGATLRTRRRGAATAHA